jgi:guanylate kinase
MPGDAIEMGQTNQNAMSRPVKSLLVVLSGLSGAGKDAVLAGLRGSVYPLEFIVTITTRARRPGEKDGVHYRFVSQDEFQRLIDQGELLEWASVYGNWYGVPRGPVKGALAAGKDVIVKVDVQGAATIKKLLPQAVSIFLTPPSKEELVQRLKSRRTESPADLELRVKTAEGELQQLPLFDYIVFNRRGETARAVAEIEAIITAEKCRVVLRELTL